MCLVSRSLAFYRLVRSHAVISLIVVCFAAVMSPTTGRRRARTRIRRPRFVSLRRQLSLAPPPPPPSAPAMSSFSAPDGVVAGHGDDKRHQLDLSPLHQDRDDPHVACLLGDDSVGGGPTLAALLGGISDASSGLPEPSSPVAGLDGDGDRLARRALRGRERWVYYRHASPPEEEVASSGGSARVVDPWWCAPQALSLKLDYEEILTTWSDRGSLYIDGDGPQVVPELHHTVPPVMVEVGTTGAWLVPEAREDRVAEKEGESREARVMRYKEKRRSRLFSKRIRYEVRKLNAEKRPRIKGRFVKREDNE